MPTLDYDIIGSDSREGLVADVKTARTNGWSLEGGVNCVTYKESDARGEWVTKFYQAVSKTVLALVACLFFAGCSTTQTRVHDATVITSPRPDTSNSRSQIVISRQGNITFIHKRNGNTRNP